MVAPAEVDMRFNSITPQFLVDDLDESIGYYRDNLGFTLSFRYSDFYAEVARDGCALHLKCAPKTISDRAHRKENDHLDAYIDVTGVDMLFAELERRGARIIVPLENRPWHCRDFYVEDPDGYIICFSEQIS